MLWTASTTGRAVTHYGSLKGTILFEIALMVTLSASASASACTCTYTFFDHHTYMYEREPTYRSSWKSMSSNYHLTGMMMMERCATHHWESFVDETMLQLPSSVVTYIYIICNPWRTYVTTTFGQVFPPPPFFPLSFENSRRRNLE